MYIIQNQSSINNLYVCVETILNRTRVSYCDDYNHRIRKYKIILLYYELVIAISFFERS